MDHHCWAIGDLAALASRPATLKAFRPCISSCCGLEGFRDTCTDTIGLRVVRMLQSASYKQRECRVHKESSLVSSGRAIVVHKTFR